MANELRRRGRDRCRGLRQYGKPVVDFLNTQLGGWLLTYGLIGLLTLLYQLYWVPASERDARRVEILSELAFRTASAIREDNRGYLTGADREYVTKSDFHRQPFRHLALELHTMAGDENMDVLRFALYPPRNEAELRKFMTLLERIADDNAVAIITLEEFLAASPASQPAMRATPK